LKVSLRVIEVTTYGPMKFFDVSSSVAEAVEGCRSGVARIFSKGSTSALVLAPPEALDGISEALSKLIPVEKWRHGNAYAHLRSTLLSTVRIIPVEDGKLLIPQSYRLYLLETRPVQSHRREVVVEVFCEGT